MKRSTSSRLPFTSATYRTPPRDPRSRAACFRGSSVLGDVRAGSGRFDSGLVKRIREADMGLGQEEQVSDAAEGAAGAAGIVLLTLASAQFLMTLDSSVMNVSIATVAKDVGTTVTGIQAAITFYTLVMASLMITGGKVGQILGRKRAFAIGCVIYGCGSL